jgi:hypothetical protein
VIEWVATASEVVAKVATPLPFTTPVPREVVPSRNVTVPVGVPPAVLETVAVNVTDCPPRDGLSDDPSTVALGLSTTCVTAVDVLVAKFESPP